MVADPQLRDAIAFVELLLATIAFWSSGEKRLLIQSKRKHESILTVCLASS